MKPIIAILAEVTQEKVTKLNPAYVKAIEGAGGVPIIFPYTESAEAIDSLIALADGFVFSGGADIEPARYGEETKPTCEEIQYIRDEFDFKILKLALATDKPILAICRGAQLVNVEFGGTLYQDLPTERPSGTAHRVGVEQKAAISHPVQIVQDSPLRTLLGKDTIITNSFHHQAIKTLGKGLAVMATAEDGVIEAVYSTERGYLQAYQWHPERLVDACEDNRKIFEGFIEAVKKQRKS